MKFFTWLFLNVVLANLLTAQTDTIPFQLTEHNNILIEAILNGEDTLDLMFHTALSSISLTTEATERLKEKKDHTKLTSKSWGGEIKSEYSTGNSLAIGKSKWDSLTVYSHSLSGQFSDGKFGPNLFGESKIELNFDLKIMVIHKVLPENVSTYQKNIAEKRIGALFLKGSCFNGADRNENVFMIHSGYSGTILLDDGFASESKMNILPIESESELRDSGGNVLKKKKAILPEFTLEGISFKDLPIGFFEGKISNQQTSVLGGELIKRFNIIFDFDNAVVFLKPNTLMGLPVKDV